jgi:hypothetical protein
MVHDSRNASLTSRSSLGRHATAEQERAVLYSVDPADAVHGGRRATAYAVPHGVDGPLAGTFEPLPDRVREAALQNGVTAGAAYDDAVSELDALERDYTPNAVDDVERLTARLGVAFDARRAGGGDAQRSYADPSDTRHERERRDRVVEINNRGASSEVLVARTLAASSAAPSVAFDPLSRISAANPLLAYMQQSPIVDAVDRALRPLMLMSVARRRQRDVHWLLQRAREAGLHPREVHKLEHQRRVCLSFQIVRRTDNSDEERLEELEIGGVDYARPEGAARNPYSDIAERVSARAGNAPEAKMRTLVGDEELGTYMLTFARVVVVFDVSGVELVEWQRMTLPTLSPEIAVFRQRAYDRIEKRTAMRRNGVFTPSPDAPSLEFEFKEYFYIF